jgi:hypothetical protein
MWCIPPKQNAEFVCAMENVLETYKRPYDPKRPVVCMDETSKQLVAETRTPQPARPGRPARYDYEYERNGTANVFMFTEPLANWREATVTRRRTAVDWAHAMRDVADTRYADAELVTFVMDNLNTHGPWSFYEAFEPAEARRLAEKIEIVYTPKHGSWLNIAEIELGVLGRQCMSGRIGSAPVLKRHVSAWNRDRNRSGGRVRWQFTTDKARVKLHRLYPQIQS